MLSDLGIVELNAMYQSAEKIYEYYAKMSEDPAAADEAYYTDYIKKRIKLYEQMSDIRKAIEAKLDELVEDEE